MVDILLPFSMPSSIASIHYPLDGPLPSLSQVRTVGEGWDRDTATSTYKFRDSGQDLIPQQLERSTCRTQHGLTTPPEEMTSDNANPLLAPFDGLHYKSVPVVGSNTASYQTREGTFANTRQNTKTQPFYHSYQSAQRPRSPVSKGESIGPREQPVRRRASSDGNSIVSHLQIPSSINSSKGSLAEFTAQVRTLLGFHYGGS